MVGLGPAAEDAAAQRVQEQTEKELKLQRLKEADALLTAEAVVLESEATMDGFRRREGLPKLDPWGNPLRAEYRQEWGWEVATLRCTGPDGLPGTPDDLTRERRTSNVWGTFNGLPGWAYGVLIWVGCGLLALLFSAGTTARRRSRGKTELRHDVILFPLVVVIVAPLAVIVLGLQCIGELLDIDL